MLTFFLKNVTFGAHVWVANPGARLGSLRPCERQSSPSQLTKRIRDLQRDGYFVLHVIEYTPSE